MTWKSSGLPQPKRQYAVQQLADAIGTSQQNASRHVRRLYEAGVLARREGGREVFYSVTTPALVELLAAATRV
jgi:DNA-binding transcriptional ArsR family regulator